MDYTELVKSLRYCASGDVPCDKCERVNTVACEPVLMSKAADAIEELQKDLERSKEWETFWEEEANEALKKLQTTVARVPRWIPVTERLPENGQDCLCYYIGGAWGQLSWISIDKYIDSDGFSGFYPWHKNGFLGSVTHWMPLPTPPKEETE